MVFYKARAFFLVVFSVGLIFSALSQEGGGDGSDEIPIESDWDGAVPTLYSRGDQIFSMTLGTLFPIVFFDARGKTYPHNLFAVGGMGALSYNYFLSPHWFAGGEISGMFIKTRNSMLYIVPMGFLGGYQFILGQFEFPLSLMLGVAPQKFLDEGYFGYLFLKPRVSAFWRFSPEWSFGLNTAWWWVPQWPKDRSKNATGNFLELTFSARIHF
ncbi:MAG: hypothetical protein LBP43_02300 [Treponema sp.]|jgi:hypothetical protein|nr:hypothetical protein [Treponema sp.]